MLTVPTIISECKPFIQENWVKANFQSSTPIQESAFPLILEGKDVIASSPTGTGKTLAYLLPLLNKIDPDNKSIQAVIIAPSRELVMQILEQIQLWTKDSGIVSASFIGGVPVKRQLEKLKKRPQIIVGSPGRMLELIKQKKMKMHYVKSIVLDEADQLLLPEHMKDITSIVKSTLADRQVIAFSATMPEETVQKVQTLMKQPEQITNTNRETTAEVTYAYIVTDAREKLDALRKLARLELGRTLVFVNDIQDLSLIAEKLAYKGLIVQQLHSDLKKEQRAKVLKTFQKEPHSVLLVSEIAARGLDLEGISHVIHYDFPKDIKQFIHRSGRTGRMGAEKGDIITIATQREERMLKQYARELELTLEKKRLFGGELLDDK